MAEAREKGCYISRFMAVFIGVCFVVGMVVVGVVVHYAVPRPTESNGGEEYTTSTGAGSTTAPITTTATPRATGLRLNKTVLPFHYDVQLIPYVYKDGSAEENARFGSFDGKATIHFTTADGTTSNSLVLHAHTLSVNTSDVRLTNGTATVPLGSPPFTEDTERQFLVFNLLSPLQAGVNYSLSMSFMGTLYHSDFQGMYLSSYVESGTTKYLATTQFETSDARRAFPCFDEPYFKATFTITLIRRSDYSSISNMPLVESTNVTVLRTPISNLKIVRQERTTGDYYASRRGGSHGWLADRYEKSIVMPTYLLAFVVSDFQHRDYQKGNITYRFWSRPEYTDYQTYAMEYFENFAGTPFQISKLDQIAIPDFAAGAMENWGLITYRETALLYNSEFSRIYDKEYVVSVIAHELAHQWFGNLVTCDWWDDLWLNEGFATYFEYLAVQSTIPESKLEEEFVRAIESVMIADSRGTSQPMYLRGLEHHDDHGSAFSSITYSKAGGVIRMIKYLLGDGTFQRALRLYLDRRAYKTAKHEDLYQALQDQAVEDNNTPWDTSRVNISQIMTSWVEQIGLPMVTISKNSDSYSISQRQFLFNSSDVMNPTYPNPYNEYLWHIPLTYSADLEGEGSTATAREWIYRVQDGSLNETKPWVVGNIFRQGYFKVNYDTNLWNQIIDQLNSNHTIISLENRGELVDDAFNLARAGIVNITLPLRVMSYLKNERNYLPWYAALRRRLRYINSMIQGAEAYPQFQQYLQDLVTPAYNYIGWNDSDTTEYEKKRLRDIIISEACRREFTDCIQTAILQYREWMSNNLTNPISANSRAVVYCYAIEHGGYDEWQFAYEMHQYYATTSDKVYRAYELYWLKQGMSCTSKAWLMQRYLDVAVEEWKSTTAVNYLAQSVVGRSFVWDLLRSQWDQLFSKGISRSSVLYTLTETLSTQYDLEQVQKFQVDFPEVGYDSVYSAIKSTIQQNIEWRAKNEPLINEFFNVPAKAGGMATFSATDTRPKLSKRSNDDRDDLEMKAFPVKLDAESLRIHV